MKLLSTLICLGLILGATRSQACSGIGDPAFPQTVTVGTLADGRTYLDLRSSYPDLPRGSDVELAGQDVSVTLRYYPSLCVMQVVPPVRITLGYLDPGTYRLLLRKVPVAPPISGGVPVDVVRTFQVQGTGGSTATQIPTASTSVLILLGLSLALIGSVALLRQQR